jgi:hypothetical protein
MIKIAREVGIGVGRVQRFAASRCDVGNRAHQPASDSLEFIPRPGA